MSFSKSNVKHIAVKKKEDKKNTTEAMVSTKNERKNKKSFSKHSKRSNQTCLL